MQTAELVVRNKVGLHARPAATFVKAAGSFKCNLRVRNLTAQRGPVNAKSIISVLTLGVEQGHTVEIAADGEDEAQAVEALRRLVDSNFGEAE